MMSKICLEDRELLRKRRVQAHSLLSAQKALFSSEFVLRHGYNGKVHVDDAFGVSCKEWIISAYSGEVQSANQLQDLLANF